MTELTGKVVAITGASSGIGEATAQEFARAGAALALAARRKSRLDALVERIADSGGRAAAFQTDVTDEYQCRDFIDGAAEAFGRLDVLVNNAGYMGLGPIESSPPEEWRRMVDVNILGVLYCTQPALRHLRRVDNGHIVNVSSLGGRVVGRWGGVYCATKFAVGALSEALRRELMDAGIRVTVIEPGRVKTELRDNLRPEVAAELEDELPAGFLPMNAAEIAKIIVWAVTQPPNVGVSEVLVRSLVSPR